MRPASPARAPLAVALLLAVAVLIATAAASCGPSNEGIETGGVQRATVVEVVDIAASVTAKSAITLTAPAEGTLASLGVESGATVAAGDIVAVIDSPSAQKRLTDATAVLAAVKRGSSRPGTIDLSGLQRSLDQAAADAFAAARGAAESADEKVRATLLAQVEAAQAHYDAAAAASRQLQKQLQRGVASLTEATASLLATQRIQAQSAYDVARSTVDALTLRAPFAGVVQYARPSGAATDPLAGLLDAVGGAGAGAAGALAGPVAQAPSAQSPLDGVDDIPVKGDRVSAGAAILTIVDISEIGLRGEVDETDVLLVHPGVTAEIELDAAPGQPYEASVTTVDLLPTATSRGGVVYPVRLRFTDLTGLAMPRPGMSAVAHLRVRTATDAVVAPASAVFGSESGEAVWLVRDGVAVRQTVTVGVRGEETVQILSGVTPGDLVVIAGADQVAPGQHLS